MQPGPPMPPEPPRASTPPAGAPLRSSAPTSSTSPHDAARQSQRSCVAGVLGPRASAALETPSFNNPLPTPPTFAPGAGPSAAASAIGVAEGGGGGGGAAEEGVPALRFQLQQTQMQLADTRASLREARASVEGAHTSGGLDHLKQIFRRYIEMDEADNAALFKVLVTMLDYPPHETKKMQMARDARVAKRTSLFGRVLGRT